MNKADTERFERIQRETGMGYGITLKDLAWLVRLVEKLAAAESPVEEPLVEAAQREKLSPRDLRKMSGPLVGHAVNRRRRKA